MRPDNIIADTTGFIAVSLILFTLTIAWVMALHDVIRNDFSSSRQKSVWILLLVFVPPIGLVLYWVVGVNQRV
jgi:uncharacterized membrane protein YhaH (DUF805 family)